MYHKPGMGGSKPLVQTGHLDQLLIVEKQIHSYINECRAKVPEFVSRRFSFEESIRSHREHIRTDFLKIALNVLITIPVHTIEKLIQWSVSLGYDKPGHYLHSLPKSLKTDFQKEVQSDIRTSIFENQDVGGGEMEYALISSLKSDNDLFLPPPALFASLEKTMESEIGDFLARRDQFSDMAASGAAYLVSALFFKKTIWGAIEIGQAIAHWIAKRTAVKHFFLGEGVGGVFYDLFPAKPTSFDYIFGMVIALAGFGILAGLIETFLDPVQNELGLVQKQFEQFLDNLETKLIGSAGKALREASTRKSPQEIL